MDFGARRRRGERFGKSPDDERGGAMTRLHRRRPREGHDGPDGIGGGDERREEHRGRGQSGGPRRRRQDVRDDRDAAAEPARQAAAGGSGANLPARARLRAEAIRRRGAWSGTPARAPSQAGRSEGLEAALESHGPFDGELVASGPVGKTPGRSEEGMIENRAAGRGPDESGSTVRVSSAETVRYGKGASRRTTRDPPPPGA